MRIQQKLISWWLYAEVIASSLQVGCVDTLNTGYKHHFNSDNCCLREQCTISMLGNFLFSYKCCYISLPLGQIVLNNPHLHYTVIEKRTPTRRFMC